MNDDKPPTVPPSFFRPPPDPEVNALETCFRALVPFDVPTRQRIIEYLDARLLRTAEPDPAIPPPGTVSELLGRVLDAADAARDPIDGCRCMPESLLYDIRAHLKSLGEASP